MELRYSLAVLLTVWLTALAADVLADSRIGRNGLHGIVDLLRQSIYGRLAGYEDVNDADRLGRDPAIRRLHRHQLISTGGVGRGLLQSSRHGSATHQGRQERHLVDSPLMPGVSKQRRPAAASRPGQQPRQLPADASLAEGRGTLVDDDAAGEAIKIGAKIVRHVTFQMAEVAVSRELFRKILSLIDDLGRRPVPA